ncbi:MAG: glycosyltransferase family 39 protein [Cytophagales bacterium]|nr:glycosyltransferase family 39 protein [Armatimonadota bacterium]
MRRATPLSSHKGGTEGAGTVEGGQGILIAILITSLVLSVLFAANLKMGDNPDEVSHLSYIRLLIEERGFVRFVADDAARFETHQPPLYYLLCVPAYLVSGGSYVVVRLVAALIQLATIGVTWRACRDLLPTRPEIAPGAAAFVAFLPTAAQLAGSINNDPLTTLFCTLIFWKLGRVAVRGGHRIEPALLLGLFLGLGLLTKLSVLQVIPAFFVAYFVAVRSRLLTASQAVRFLSVALVVGFLVASPWLIRNTRFYGDPFTLKIFPLTAGVDTPTPEKMMRLMGWTFDQYLSITAVRTFATFWFVLPPNRLIAAVGPLALVSLFALGGAWGAVASWVRARQMGDADSAALARLTAVYAAGLLLLIPFFARFVLTFFQAQGRYFLPALLPVAVLTVLGWGSLPGKLGRYGLLLVTISLLLLSLFQIASLGKGLAA